MEEIWKDIKNYEGIYQISNLGRVKRLSSKDSRNHLRKEKILKPALNSCGYYHIGLSKDGIYKKKTIHRMLMETFIPNPNNLPEINHINEIKTDNSLSNLEWCTHYQNMNSGTVEKRALINSLRTKYLKKIMSKKERIKMKRDDIKKILGENATEEQISNLLNAFHNSNNESKQKIDELNEQLSKYSDYNAIKTQLNEIQQANMSEQEKIEQMKKETENNLRESRIIVNTAKAKEILAGESIDEKLIQSLVDDNLENTIAKATMFKQTLTNLKDSVAKQTKESLVNADLKPTIPNVNPNENVMTLDKFGNMSAEEQNKWLQENPNGLENLN